MRKITKIINRTLSAIAILYVIGFTVGVIDGCCDISKSRHQQHLEDVAKAHRWADMTIGHNDVGVLCNGACCTVFDRRGNQAYALQCFYDNCSLDNHCQ